MCVHVCVCNVINVQAEKQFHDIRPSFRIFVKGGEGGGNSDDCQTKGGKDNIVVLRHFYEHVCESFCGTPRI